MLPLSTDVVGVLPRCFLAVDRLLGEVSPLFLVLLLTGLSMVMEAEGFDRYLNSAGFGKGIATYVRQGKNMNGPFNYINNELQL